MIQKNRLIVSMLLGINGFVLSTAAMENNGLYSLAAASALFAKNHDSEVSAEAARTDSLSCKKFDRHGVTLVIKCPGKFQRQLYFSVNAAKTLLGAIYNPKVCRGRAGSFVRVFLIDNITPEAVDAFYNLLVLNFFQQQRSYLEQQSVEILQQLIHILRAIEFKKYTSQLADFGQTVLDGRMGMSEEAESLDELREKMFSDKRGGVKIAFTCAAAHRSEDIFMPCRLAGQLCSLFTSANRQQGKNGNSIACELTQLQTNIGLTFLKVFYLPNKKRVQFNRNLSEEEARTLAEIYRHFEGSGESRRLKWLMRDRGQTMYMHDIIDRVDETPVTRKRSAEPLERDGDEKRRAV